MSESTLVSEAWLSLHICQQMLQKAVEDTKITHHDAKTLLKHARAACSCIQTIERLAAGVQKPKLGD